MKTLAILALVAGAVLLVVLVAHFGLDAIVHALGTLGWSGFAAIVAFHLGLMAAMGGAWFLLGRGRADARPGRFMWARVIRDSASETLPLSQLGGFVLGTRALTLTGVAGNFAAASTVVDVAVELVSQLAYVLIGLALLVRLRPGNPLALPVLGGVGAMSVLAMLFIGLQARGAGWVERATARLTREFLGIGASGSGSVQDAIRGIHRRRGALAGAALVHLCTWVGSGVEAWITLRLMGIALSLGEALVIDSLLYGIRSAAFLVPNAMGVQEGGYILLGSMFGIGPEVSLALSLIRRGRDLGIGVPALLAWQAMEGRRAWRGVGTAAPPQAGNAQPGAARDGTGQAKQGELRP